MTPDPETRPMEEPPLPPAPDPKPPPEIAPAEQPPAADAFTWGDGLCLEIAESRLEASLTVDFSVADRYTPDDLSRFLRENQVVHGVDEGILRDLIEEKTYNQSVTVAQGVPAVDGENGRVEWDVDLSVLEGAKLIEKGGRVD